MKIQIIVGDNCSQEEENIILNEIAMDEKLPDYLRIEAIKEHQTRMLDEEEVYAGTDSTI